MKYKKRKIKPSAKSKDQVLNNHIPVENCLFIGNGFNRCLGDSFSWEDLLKTIAEEFKVNYNSSNPMPIEFEKIINSYLRDKQFSDKPYNVYTKTKYIIARNISKSKLPENSVHHELRKIRNNKINAIMTTNYDFLLEYAFDPKYKFDKVFEKFTHLPYSTYQIDGIEFYHVHGCIGQPKTICLGYDHYMNIVSQLRSEISKKQNNTNQSMLIRQILLGQRTCLKQSWGQRFFTSNIAIVGFGLAQCEADIWWLLSYRAYLYYTNYYGMKELIENNIVFYRVIDGEKRILDQKLAENLDEFETSEKYLTKDEAEFNDLLRSEHIGVNTYIIGPGQTFEDAYRRIIQDIDKYGIKEYHRRISII